MLADFFNGQLIPLSDDHDAITPFTCTWARLRDFLVAIARATIPRTVLFQAPFPTPFASAKDADKPVASVWQLEGTSVFCVHALYWDNHGNESVEIEPNAGQLTLLTHDALPSSVIALAHWPLVKGTPPPVAPGELEDPKVIAYLYSQADAVMCLLQNPDGLLDQWDASKLDEKKTHKVVLTTDLNATTTNIKKTINMTFSRQGMAQTPMSGLSSFTLSVDSQGTDLKVCAVISGFVQSFQEKQQEILGDVQFKQVVFRPWADFKLVDEEFVARQIATEEKYI